MTAVSRPLVVRLLQLLRSTHAIGMLADCRSADEKQQRPEARAADGRLPDLSNPAVARGGR